MEYVTATRHRLAAVDDRMAAQDPRSAYERCAALLIAASELPGHVREPVLDVAVAAGRIAHGDGSDRAWAAYRVAADRALGALAAAGVPR